MTPFFRYYIGWNKQVWIPLMKKIVPIFDETTSLSRIKHKLNVLYTELKSNDKSFDFEDKNAFFEHIEEANDPEAEFDRWHSISRRR